MNNKIFELKKEKINFRSIFKINKKRISLCHGVFDLLHVGHIDYFRESKKISEILVVSLTSDKFVNKGNNKPFFNHYIRANVIASIECVDFVIINHNPIAIPIIDNLRPNFYCKGPDFKKLKSDLTKNIYIEKKAIEKVGGKIYFTSGNVYSSSRLINESMNIYNDEQKKIINHIKSLSTFFNINKDIENFSKKKVLVIGETIIDRYNFVEAVGKSGKEPMMVFSDHKVEDYTGGTVAIAKNVNEFSKNVKLVSILGEKNEFKKYVLENISSKIKTKFFSRKGSKTILKKRYIDLHSNNKIIGVYNTDTFNIDKSLETKVYEYLNKIIKNYDVVILADYGHGFITPKIAKLIQDKSKYLMMNFQINSSNIGYHDMSKFKKTNSIIMNENELRHELRDKVSDVKDLIFKFTKKINFEILIVTSGRAGVTLYSKKNRKIYKCPAFTSTVVDKVGAGDSMMSICALCCESNLNPSINLFVSSIAAVQAVNTIGNKNKLDKVKLLKEINHTLK